MNEEVPDLTIESLLERYRRGGTRPREVVRAAWERAAHCDPAIWISRPSWEQVDALLGALEDRDSSQLPLYGVPFAIKDNIDWAGQPTTAACPAFSYTPGKSAFVVDRLIAAGAIPVGKANLDQFATGLVGMRSPYGTPANAFHPDYIPGGSSSGSAVAVAEGLASFALGTDTAGSGRVPASFNNLVGLKPTRGALSCSGVVPACRTLDVVSIFALSVADAMRVFDVVAVYDSADPFAREFVNTGPRHRRNPACIGIPLPSQFEFFGNDLAAALFERACGQLQDLGWQTHEVDIQPFLDAARLLYDGPWIAERYAAVKELIERNPEALHPVTREIIGAGAQGTAVDAFKAQYRLAELRRLTDGLWEQVDAIMLPTAGIIPTKAEVEADPIRRNSNLGYYTNFMNLLDLSAWAVPAGFMENGLPFGVTFFAQAFEDRYLGELSQTFHAAQRLPIGKTRVRSDEIPQFASGFDHRLGWIKVAVCGAHMEGLPLNHQLTSRGGRLVARTRSAPVYRLFRLPGKAGIPDRPGMVRVSEGGSAIELEIWALPEATIGSFLDGIAAPLGLGRVELSGGGTVCGFICETAGATEENDITVHGGWRAFLAA